MNVRSWLDLMWSLQHWPSVRAEVIARVRAACLVECVPRHVAAYLHFLARCVLDSPRADHTDLALVSHPLLMN